MLALLSDTVKLILRYYQTRQLRYRRILNFLNFVKHTDSVDERVTQAYLRSQARPGREARLSQQPRHQPYHLPPVAFTKPAVISGQRSINGLYLCI